MLRLLEKGYGSQLTLAHDICTRTQLHRYGGWGNGPKFPHPEAIDFALVQVSKRNDDRMREVVTTTLDRLLESPLHDSVDSGFFRFSRTPDWRATGGSPGSFAKPT